LHLVLVSVGERWRIEGHVHSDVGSSKSVKGHLNIQVPSLVSHSFPVQLTNEQTAVKVNVTLDKVGLHSLVD